MDNAGIVIDIVCIFDGMGAALEPGNVLVEGRTINLGSFQHRCRPPVEPA